MVAVVADAVQAANEHLARVQQVKQWELLPVEWTAETEELTPTFKLKRRVMHPKYADVIDGLYASRGSLACCAPPRLAGLGGEVAGHEPCRRADVMRTLAEPGNDKAGLELPADLLGERVAVLDGRIRPQSARARPPSGA